MLNRKEVSSAHRALIGVVLAFVILTIGMVIGRYDLLPISKAANFVKSLKKDIAVALAGEEEFVRKTLDQHYREPELPSDATVRGLDTSLLPLRLTEMPLAISGEFADSESVVGGSIAVVENSLFVLDKLGNIFRFSENTLERMDYDVLPLGLHESITNSVEPFFLTATKTLYLAYDAKRSTILVSLQRFDTSSRQIRFNISALEIDPQTLQKRGGWSTVFETEDIPNDSSFRGAHGGKMVVDGDMLYFTVGDYNWGQVPQKAFGFVAQNRSAAFGKTYEHNLVTKKTRVKSIGHRNPQGLVLTEEGDLITTEHGPEGGDELNLVVDDQNYGWPFQTYGTHYGTFNWPITHEGPEPNFQEPLYAWVPSVAISPLIQVTGFNPRWDGDLLAGSLQAQSLFRIKIKHGRVLFVEPIWIGHRIRDIVQLREWIVLITDDPALVFISVDKERLEKNSKLQQNLEFVPALAKCMNCHHFGETNPTHLAPSLRGVLNSPIASDSFARYSEALQQKGGIWDVESLAEFVRNPGDFAPGTTMPAVALSEYEMDEVISALGTEKRYGY